MGDKIKIREATKRDFNSISKLNYEYGEYEKGLDNKIHNSSLKDIKKQDLNHFIDGTTYFLIEKNKKLIGVLSINIDKRGIDNIGVLHTLIITKEERGKGYGSKLAEFAYNYLKNNKCRRVRTFIHFANKNAQEFWKKQGFELEHGYTGVKMLK